MADGIIGTAGVFFSLVLIAAGSFAVGLIVFCVLEFIKTRLAHRRGSGRRSQDGPATLSAVKLAQRVHGAAEQAAHALLRSLAPAGAVEAECNPAAHTRVTLEFTCALLRMLDANMAELLGSHYTDTYAHTLEDICVGDLYRAAAGRCDLPLQALVARRLAEYRAGPRLPPDLLVAAALISERLAACVAEAVGGGDVDAERLQSNTAELLRSAVTLDLRPHLM
jgi:hypothetical protein